MLVSGLQLQRDLGAVGVHSLDADLALVIGQQGDSPSANADIAPKLGNRLQTNDERKVETQVTADTSVDRVAPTTDRQADQGIVVIPKVRVRSGNKF